jgi:hypothetical protein
VLEWGGKEPFWFRSQYTKSITSSMLSPLSRNATGLDHVIVDHLPCAK